MAQSTGKLVTVFGGAGFVGRHAIRALVRQGWRVRAASRRPDLAGHLQPMGAVGQIHAVQANLRYPDSISRALEGADAVVNLVAILHKSGAQTFERLHVDGARAIAEAARTAGCRQLVHISAIGADSRATSTYARTKGQGETAVLKSFPDAVILRPSLIFGPEDQLFNRFAGLAAMSPVMPLVGARTRFQPIYVGDVAAAIAAALGGRARAGTVYEIGGPEVVTMRQIIDRTEAWAGRSRWRLPMPFWLAKLSAFLTVPLPNGLRPLTVDQVRLLQVDNIVSEAAATEHRTLADLGITEPHAMELIVPQYLERFRPRGQFSHYRG